MSRLSICVAVTALTFAASAYGQTTGDAQSSPPPQTTTASDKPATVVQSLTVTGKTPDERRYIDRRSYSLTRDIQATNGSLADALRNIPSVDVDPRGNLSVRGSGNVTILVDGQPSALFQGQNLADVLRELPADQFERVEVITNPSAAYKPDGTGGIINLISKKSHHAKPTGTVKASVDVGGRYNAAVDGNATLGELTLSGGAGYRYDFNSIDAVTAQQLSDPVSGDSARTSSVSHAWQEFTTLDLHTAADDDLDANTRLSANAGYFSFDADQPVTSLYRSSTTTGAFAQDYASTGDIGSHGSGGFGGVTWRRQFAGDDHNLVVSFSYNDFTTVNINREALSYSLPIQPDLFQNLAVTRISSTAELKAEYKSPMPAQGRLDAGYDLEFDGNTEDRDGLVGTDPADATGLPSLSDRFRADQTISALFVTYQQPVGRVDILPGLRLEAATLDTDRLLIGAKTTQTYLEAYPTLHLGYKWNDKTQLTLSYSRRVQRPNLEQLDPFRVYSTPLSYSQGDLALKPSITDSYEAGYEFSEKSNDYLLTLYYRDQHDMVTTVTETLGDGVFLESAANIGENRSAGGEAVISQQITKTLALKLTADAFWNQLSDADPSLAAYRSGVVVKGHGSLNWDITPNDFVQIGAYANGRQVTAQGATNGYIYLNLGYRHKFSDRLAVELLVLDPANSFRTSSVLTAPGVSQTSKVSFGYQTISLGFTYALGGPAKSGKDFDFSGGSHH